MCRIMHWIGNTNEQTLAAFTAFQRLADEGTVPTGHEPGHKDGWGIVAYRAHSTEIETVKKSCASATHPESDFLASVIQAVTQGSTNIMTHLRKASPGMAVTEENVHPFTYQQFSFCHNGLVEDFHHDSLRLTEPYTTLRKGNNDSEHLFMRLLQEHEHLANPCFGDTLHTFVQRLRKIQYRSFITLSSDGDHLYICREVNEKNNVFEKAPYLIEEYYSFFLGHNPSRTSLIGCSESLPLDGVTWQAVPNHTLITINRHTLEETWRTI